MLVGRVGLAQLVVLLARLVAATSIAFSQLLSAPALVAHAATPTAQCAGAAFQFPVNGVVGWRWHDPRSQWYDPNTGTFADTANGTIDGTPIIHAGIDIFPRGSNAVYPLASGEVVRVGGESFNIWYPDQDIYSYFTHVVHHLK